MILIDAGYQDYEFTFWIDDHRSAIETYVENGGRVWFNAALGFGSEGTFLFFDTVWFSGPDAQSVTCAPGAELDPVYQRPHKVACDMYENGDYFAFGALAAVGPYNYTILTLDTEDEDWAVLLRVEVGLGEVKCIMSISIDSFEDSYWMSNLARISGPCLCTAVQRKPDQVFGG